MTSPFMRRTVLSEIAMLWNAIYWMTFMNFCELISSPVNRFHILVLELISP